MQMKRIWIISTILCAFLCLISCEKDIADTPVPSESQDENPQQIWPKPMNRTGYVVESISWYNGPKNHKEAVYQYDDHYRLIKRILHVTFEECNQVKTSIYIDTIEYEGEQVHRITTILDGASISNVLFFYDEQGRLEKTTNGNNTTYYAYRNGLMDSIYNLNNPDFYTILEYDMDGNVVKEHIRMAEMDNYGMPTGGCYLRTNEYEYDNQSRPNFNMDNAFVYEPIFGQGTTYPTYIRMISPHNMTRFSNGHETWGYEYNEQGLPQSMYHQYNSSPSNPPIFNFTYRAIEE